MEFVWAFVVGGLFCVVAQILVDKTKITPARILVLYVVGGVVLFAVGLYEPISRFAGSGIGVPIVGYGGLLAQGVKSAVDEQGLMGALTGGMTATAAGVTAALLLGSLAAVLFRSKQK